MNSSTNRILLIEPPFYRLYKSTYSLDRYPLALGYLAGTVRRQTDWGVLAYNADFTPRSEQIQVSYLGGEGFDRYLENLKAASGGVWDEVRSALSVYGPTVVGISTKSQNFASACVVAALAKELDRRTVVIVGGPHPSMVGPRCLEACPDIDAAVRGEGERTLVELLHRVQAHELFDGVAGIAYRKDGRILENAAREFIGDLDSLCFPSEGAADVLKDYEQYPATAFRYVFATRGCPYNCFFCGSRNIWSRRARFRSATSVVREIQGLQKMGVRFMHFSDDTFGVNKGNIAALCDALKADCPAVRWSCELHVKLVDDDTLSAMKAAGCHSIQLGIESGNNEMLRAMRKGMTIEEALAACELIRRHGIALQVFFMIGFPQETEQTLADTAAAMRKIKCDEMVYSIFTPYPGTEAFEFCRAEGLIGDDFDVALYNHQSPANCFCANIDPARFRALASDIGRMVDQKNWGNRMRRVFSLRTLGRIRELGLGRALRKGLKVFTGK